MEFSLTVEKALPTTDSESEEYLQVLAELVDLGFQHFVMDFGNPETPDDALRFVEQVMAPLRAR